MTTSETLSFPQGERLVFTGRLAAMSRPVAIARVLERGGTVHARVSRNTSCIVIGGDGWPLRSSGRLTRNLQRASELEQVGYPISIITESEFLRRLDPLDEAESIQRYYTVEQLSRLVGISGLRLRRWSALGLIQPLNAGESVELFDYLQVASIRSLVSLLRQRASRRTLVQSLDRLQCWLPQDVSLATQLQWLRGAWIVRDQQDRLVEHTGQFHFDFTDSFHETTAARGFVSDCDDVDADTLYDRAYACENAGRLAEARSLYEGWVTRFGDDPEVLFNYGNVCLNSADYPRAIECYRTCLRLQPQRPETWNNLGLCHAHQNDWDSAVEALQQALTLNPDYADACYNLADILDEAGRTSEARLLWLRFIRSSEQNDTPELRYAQQCVSERPATTFAVTAEPLLF